MKRSPRWMRNGLLGVSTLLLVLCGGGPITRAEDPPATPGDDEPSTSEEAVPEPEPDVPDPTKKKMPFGLYVAVAGGEGSGDPFNMSIANDQSLSEASLELNRLGFGFASVGWRLPDEKGDFRIMFRGYKEEEYDFRAVGKQSLTETTGRDPGVVNTSCAAGAGIGIGPCLIPWWVVEASNGHLHSVRTPSTWIKSQDDTNGNGLVDLDEVHFHAPDRVIDLQVPDSLETQMQTIDLMYGREFGGRRISSRWWAGLRYYQFKGNLLAGAWLVPTGFEPGPDEGFTDGSLIRLLNISQDSSGFGPTGSWEIDLNFFNKGLALYGRAQSALTFSSLESDSGPFFTVIKAVGSSDTYYLPARMEASRNKSSWQNTGEAGVRVLLQNGLQFELAYSLTGFLDVVLAPSSITVPAGTPQSSDGVSGLYATQDYLVSGWHASVGFQF